MKVKVKTYTQLQTVVMLTQEVRVDEPTGRNLLGYLRKAGMSERGIDELHKLTLSDLRREESDHTNDE